MSERDEGAERALTELLRTRLPRARAPQALHARMAAMVEPKPRARWPRVATALVTFAVAAMALLVVTRREPENPLLRELVNDHLRILYAQHPIEIESGGIHQVKPWFAGRLDFAPRVAVDDDPDFPLQGGAISYVLDRKAAAFVFKRRLHVITVLVFPERGLHWPADDGKQALSERGFNVLLFRRQDLGYALISDLNAGELRMLGQRL